MADSTEAWTVRRMLEWTEAYLGDKGDENPRLSAQWLVGAVCGLSRVGLYTALDRPLDPSELERMRGFVQRRGAAEPLQYIVGECAFRHITLKTRKGVLIPRPETEVLVSEALALLPARPSARRAEDDLVDALAAEAERIEGDPASSGVSDRARELLLAARESARTEDPGRLLVADLCTGSGCIACSLAYEHPLVRAFATDIAPEAVELARENVADLGLADRVKVLSCSLGEGIPQRYRGCLDLVVSNPPYVPTGVLAGIPREVSDFEPALALDGGDDGLDVFRPLAAWAFDFLRPGGALAVELHETCLDAAAAHALDLGFVSARAARDLAGRPRILCAVKPDDRTNA
ncbi:MAG: HemK/PrmC family methyltransferase [Berryella intestinalis]|uniref:N5-glutamine methyltransferase family protein n=1 Tax=Berryella intestinalis TaxID=1531429 RepID=UPI002A4EE7E7|nr:HemK/PrmC family methyltransferase [Berryella intestinalis]MDD7369298.1 peptide chain release factor N(5)-glutamine methyltransferase [Berryella intestinalis]MDY3129392.1 HemK/PrmC family methyltransferase [Berryella intestinalis]